MKRRWLRFLYWLIELTVGYPVLRGRVPDPPPVEEKEIPYWETPEYRKKAMDNQLLCTMCTSTDKWPYDNTGAVLHQRDGMHHTMGLTTQGSPVASTWKPVKGHAMWNRHTEIKKLGLIDSL